MLAGLLSRAWPWLISIFLVTMLVFLGKRNAVLSQRVKQIQGKNNAQNRMRKAAAQTRTDRASVIDRLRDGKF